MKPMPFLCWLKLHRWGSWSNGGVPGVTLDRRYCKRCDMVERRIT